MFKRPEVQRDSTLVDIAVDEVRFTFESGGAVNVFSLFGIVLLLLVLLLLLKRVCRQ